MGEIRGEISQLYLQGSEHRTRLKPGGQRKKKKKQKTAEKRNEPPIENKKTGKEKTT